MKNSRQRLSQHFLTDHGAIRRIVDAASVQEGDGVVEVGPGKGALTELLVEGPGTLVGIELDSILCTHLRKRFGNRLTLINKDVLEVDFSTVFLPATDRFILVGNLPYHVSGAIIEKILEARDLLSRAVVMVQREVAHRMIAAPGKKDYGILSIAVQLHCSPSILFEVPPSSFDPEPKVHSSVLRLDFGASRYSVTDERLLFKMLRQVFTQRRKMIKNTLAPFFSDDALACEQALLDAGVHPTDRPEMISIPQFEDICKGLASFRNSSGKVRTGGSV
jgi:16S rRNA (adenine1518-N6/adenine1519-N6)-dimethyltransferase